MITASKFRPYGKHLYAVNLFNAEDIFHITGHEPDLLDYEAPQKSCHRFEMT